MRTPQETHDAMAASVKEGIQNAFPLTSGKHTLEVGDVQVDNAPAHDDWNGQKEAVMAGRTWGAPITGNFSLKDETGAVIDKKKMRVGFMPTVTNRNTYIVNGKEYSVANQRRLRPGIYTKLNRLGEPMADFNLRSGRNMSVVLDPEESQFHIKVGNTHVPLNTITKRVFGHAQLGIPGFEKEFTPEEELSHLKTLHSELMYNTPLPDDASGDVIASALHDRLMSSGMDKDVNKMTVGHDHGHVSGEALKDAADHVLRIHKKELEPTGKEQMAYTEIHGVEDFLGDRLKRGAGLIKHKIRTKLDRADKIDDLPIAGAITPLIQKFFTGSSLSTTAAQINPLEMAEHGYKITSMGDGGIGDTNAIPNEIRAVHPSQIGFIDPVRTPDNFKAGVDVRAAIGVKKIGKQLYQPVVDARTGKTVMKSPVDLYDKVVAHDKETLDGGFIRAVRHGQFIDAKQDEIDYLVPTERQFTVSTAIVPFVSSSHAHRSAMGAKMLGQALSLVDRESPIVDTTHSDEHIKGILPVASVAGTVSNITPGNITIKGVDGKSHTVNYPHEFPLNGGSFLHTTLHVKEGDHVKSGQVLGDNNFSKNGHMALGKNLNVAFLPFKGLNYEDGIAATEQGAAKLTSQHQFIHDVEYDPRNVHDAAKWKAHFPGKFDTVQLSHLDTTGIVKPGTILQEGSPIMAIMREKVQNPEQLILGKAHKSLMQPFSDTSIVWDKPYEGHVTAVKGTSKGVKVTIAANAPLVVGDKLSGRHGNKGVVTSIIPDHLAPRTADGSIPDVMLNSAGLNSRMNNAQIYEIAAAKAIKGMGMGSHRFAHFSGGNTHAAVKELVDKSGIPESEEMFDGETGRSIGKNLFGPLYMLKLFKTADSGYSARSGGSYDIDMRPTKGGDEGAKSVGTLDLSALLSHGAHHILRESATTKAEYSPEAFHALWSGLPLPPPKPTFAYQKFQAMLEGAGVNVKKEGSKLTLLPLTDKDVLAKSNGLITRAVTVNDKEDPATGLPFRPESGGLFDPHVTGGLVGNHWGHITLAEPTVNPLYANPVRMLLGMNKAQFGEAIAQEGGEGIAKMLSTIDPVTHIKTLNAKLKETNNQSARDVIHKQLRYLNALKKNNLKPDEAYVLHHVPVIPPNFRTIYPDAETGAIVNSDANRLYQNMMIVSDQLASQKKDGDPDMIGKLRTGLHESLAAVQGLDGNVEKAGKDEEVKGFLKIIAGTTSAKEGFFQSKLMSRRQDVAGRGVAIPDPSLGLDQVGLPEPMAWKILRNHTMGEMVRAGMPLDVAADHIKDQSDTGRKALLAAMGKTPVLLSRAPSLHKFNVQAFMPTLVAGKSIKVNNLIHKGFNLDHDGDCIRGTVIIASHSGISNLTVSRLNHIVIPSQESGDGGNFMLNGNSTVPMASDEGKVLEVVDLANFPRIESSKKVKENGNESYDVPEGVEIFAYDQKDGKIKLFPVTEYSVHRNLQMVDVETRSGRTIDCSDDHSLYGIDPQTLVIQKVKPCDSIGWMIPRPRRITVDENISSFSMGDAHNVTSGRGWYGSHQIASNLPMGYESGYFLGAMAGDGYASKDGGRLGLCNVEQDVFDRVKLFLESSVCAALSFSEHDNQHDFDGHDSFSRKLHWSSVALNRFVAEQIGQGSENKHLPPLWLRSPEEFRWGLMAGLLDTDGTVNRTTSLGGKKVSWHVRYDSKSMTLVNEVMLLANTLGIRATYASYHCKKGNLFHAAVLSVTDIRTHADRLTLSVPKKILTLKGMVEANPSNQSTHDAIPVPKELALAIRKAFKAPRNADGRHKSLYVLIDKAARTGGMNRDTAKEVVRRIGEACVREMPLGNRWLEIVNNDDTLWDEVVKISKGDSGATAYDMTVPGTWTFMLSNGLIVQDCINIHVPLGPEAIQEAKNLMPSKNLFNPLNNAPVNTPTNETTLGLWKVTNHAGKKAVKHFATRAEAMAAYQKGEIRVDDAIEVGS